MSLIGWSILFFAIYLLVMVYFGWLGYKRTKNIFDFAVAGRQMGPVIVAASFVATSYSVALYLGYPGWGWQWGLSPLWYFGFMAVGVPLGYVIFFKRLRVTTGTVGAVSLPDWIGQRYNSSTLRVLAAVVTFAVVAYMASQLAGMAKLTDSFTGIGYDWALIIIGVVVVAYIAAGGTFAHMWSDALQMLIMAVASVVLFLSAFWVFKGGFTEIYQLLKAEDPALVNLFNPASPITYSPFAVACMFLLVLMIITWPHMAKITMALKSEADIKKCLYYVLLFNFLAVWFFWIGLYPKALGLDVASMDYAAPAYMIWLLPAGIAAFFGIAIISAGMSTIDTQLTMMSTSVVHDIYHKTILARRYPKGDYDQERVRKKEMLYLRLSCVGLAVIAIIILYLFPPASVGLLIWIGLSGLMAGLAGPVLLGMFWRGGTRIGAIVSMLSGITIYVIFMLLGLIRSSFVVGVVCAAIATVIFIIVSLFTKPLPKEHVDKFFAGVTK